MSIYSTHLDPEQIQHARGLNVGGDRLHFRVEDASKLTFEDASFDLVVSQDVFHHIAAWPRAVREIARVLREKGYLIWIDMVFPSVITRLFKSRAKNYGLYTLDGICREFRGSSLTERFHECKRQGPFTYHHFVLQKT